MRYKNLMPILAVLFSCVFFSCVTDSDISVRKSEALFSKPESVVLDKDNQYLYVSNINGSPSKKDGNGFISKISVDGEVINLKWIDNLDAPKGMCVKNNVLYCTDIDHILFIDINKGSLSKTLKIPGAEFLNDIVVTGEDTVITTDSKRNTVFIIENDDIKASSLKLKGANGIYFNGSTVFLGANGNINIYDPETDSIEIIYKGLGNIDGLILSGENFIFSNYFNKISIIENGNVSDIEKGLPFMTCRTDFCILEDGTLAVPDFNSRLVFYNFR